MRLRNFQKALFILLILGSNTSYGQSDSSTIIKSKIVSPWTRSGSLNLGGTNFNFNGNGLNKFNFNACEVLSYQFYYQKNKITKTHQFYQSFNLSKNGTDAIQKSVDNFIYKYRFEIDHKKNTNYGFLINLTTQIAPGTSSGSINDTSVISNLFAPAIISEGLTYGFNSKKGFHISYSPLAGKHTLVLNKNIDPTQYGVDTGKRARHELGTFLSLGIDELQIGKKFTISTQSLFFTNYLENFGKIDMATTVNMQFNFSKWLSLTNTMNLSYDDDHNVLIASDLVTNTGSSIVYTGSKFQISNVVYLSININFDLIKKKK